MRVTTDVQQAPIAFFIHAWVNKQVDLQEGSMDRDSLTRPSLLHYTLSVFKRKMKNDTLDDECELQNLDEERRLSDLGNNLVRTEKMISVT